MAAGSESPHRCRTAQSPRGETRAGTRTLPHRPCHQRPPFLAIQCLNARPADSAPRLVSVPNAETPSNHSPKNRRRLSGQRPQISLVIDSVSTIAVGFATVSRECHVNTCACDACKKRRRDERERVLLPQKTWNGAFLKGRVDEEGNWRSTAR